MDPTPSLASLKSTAQHAAVTTSAHCMPQSMCTAHRDHLHCPAAKCQPWGHTWNGIDQFLASAAIFFRYCSRCECTNHHRSPQFPPGTKNTTPSGPIALNIAWMLHLGNAFRASWPRPGNCDCAQTYLTDSWKLGTKRAAAAHRTASPRFLCRATS